MDTLNANKFVLTPRPLKHLSEYVVGVLWNAVAKTLHVEVRETSKLEVFEWMQYIKKQQAEIQKGPFVDLNKDALTLQFLSDTDESIACLKFKSISLMDHSCYLTTEEKQDMVHQLLLGYQAVEILPKLEDDIVPMNINKVADEEWKAEL